MFKQKRFYKVALFYIDIIWMVIGGIIALYFWDLTIFIVNNMFIVMFNLLIIPIAEKKERFGEWIFGCKWVDDYE
jgi:hypothetical protein